MSGSSPHTWGTGFNLQNDALFWRFIPTHVGNRVIGGMPSTLMSVHPHTRGEQIFYPLSFLHISGSSPHTWGTGVCNQTSTTIRRFIPTHVGNSWWDNLAWNPVAVHPHTRGEQVNHIEHHAPRSGSSPHTWGTVQETQWIKYNGRFIPTHVGNRSYGASCDCCRTVHPHTRGEQFGMQCFSEGYCGSSPHTWGTVFCAFCCLFQFRFIPTHVGNRLRPITSILSVSVHPHTRGEQGI